MTGDLMDRFNQIFDKQAPVRAPDVVVAVTGQTTEPQHSFAEAQAVAFVQSMGFTLPPTVGGTEVATVTTDAKNGTAPVVTEIDPPALPIIPKVVTEMDPPALPIIPKDTPTQPAVSETAPVTTPEAP